MIGIAHIEVRCDGKDRSLGDRCKCSQVVSLDLDELRFIPSSEAPGLRSAFFCIRMPGWSLGGSGQIFCPNCKR